MIEANLDLVPRVIRKRWKGHEDRDDLEQAGAVGLIQAARRFDTRHGIPFRSYAVRRIVGEACDWLRNEQRQRRGEPLEIDPVGRADQVAEVTVLDIREELLRPLPERTAVMAQLYFFEGHTLLEIARRFAVTESAVCKLLKNVRRRLREMLTA